MVSGNLKNTKTSSKRVNEQEGEIKKRIARLSFRLSTKAEFSDINQIPYIGAALSLLTQAMILADSDRKEAIRLLNQARKVAKGGKGKKESKNERGGKNANASGKGNGTIRHKTRITKSN